MRKSNLQTTKGPKSGKGEGGALKSSYERPKRKCSNCVSEDHLVAECPHPLKAEQAMGGKNLKGGGKGDKGGKKGKQSQWPSASMWNGWFPGPSKGQWRDWSPSNWKGGKGGGGQASAQPMSLMQQLQMNGGIYSLQEVRKE